MAEQVRIFDTTLRDGEQAPGQALVPAEKLQVARQLARLGVDVIEAGFPAASPADFRGVADVAAQVEGPIIAALARCIEPDITCAADALRAAPRARIHIFLATSDLHLQHKLQLSRAEALTRIAAGVATARELTDDVQFSAEDASRTDLGFLCEAVVAAIEAGATTINLPDTVGYALPAEHAAMFRTVQERVPAARGVVLSAHCHDDLGLATANSLAAIAAGVRQVECTVNGIGERAGNAALEEVVMATRVRGAALGVHVGVLATEIHRTSQLLAHLTGVHPQPNKAIVGRNAFAHEAGIHQHGMLKDRRTYEVIRPADVGVPTSRLVLGRHSGRAALCHRFVSLGWELDETTLDRAYAGFLRMAERKAEMHDEDLIGLVHEAFREVPVTHTLTHLAVECGTVAAHATLRMTGSWRGERCGAASGDGPIAASFAAVAGILDMPVEVEELELRALTPGRDATGEVFLRARCGKLVFSGQGQSTDVVEAAVRALLVALDKAAFARQLEAETLAGVYLWGV